jgi:alcohol dehydrogenase
MKFKKYAERLPQYTLKAMMPFVKMPKPPVLSGVGMVRRFPEVMAMTAVKRVLIICDDAADGSFTAQFQEDLKQQEIASVVYRRSAGELELHEVYNAVDVYLSELCDGVVGVGGGSAIDCAKLVAARVTNIKPIPKMDGVGKVLHRLPPMFAVPTAFGSGSEASTVAMALDGESGRKLTVVDPKLCPLAVCLDPKLTTGLSPAQTAYMGMEALTLAIEADVGLFDSDEVRTDALDATRLIFENLEEAVKDPGRLSVRMQMQKAACLAGEAFSRGSAGYTFIISNVLAARYQLPTAPLNAAILPHVLDFSKARCAEKLAELAYNAGFGTEWDENLQLAEALIDRLHQMNRSFGIAETVPELKPGDISDLADAVMAAKNPAYPVPEVMEKGDCERLLAALLD